jgi:hypothetical protein
MLALYEVFRPSPVFPTHSKIILQVGMNLLVATKSISLWPVAENEHYQTDGALDYFLKNQEERPLQNPEFQSLNLAG